MRNWNLGPLLRLAERFEGEDWDRAVVRAGEENEWFTRSQVVCAVGVLKEKMLSRESLEEWLSGYCKPEGWKPRTIGIVMAGNLPLVGFADLAAVVAVGHRAVVKPSSKDRALMEYVVGRMGAGVEVVDELPAAGLDAVIATGGDEARRVFGERYGGLPAILRGDRQSVAILAGAESDSDWQGLAEDMFRYWGLGCRNVVRLFVPEGFPVEHLVGTLARFQQEELPAYRDCYRYAKATAVMRGAEWSDGGWFILSEAGWEYQAPKLAEAFWTEYTDRAEVDRWIADNASKIQCVVGKGEGLIPFGQSQRPGWTDYADGVDTVEFLLNL